MTSLGWVLTGLLALVLSVLVIRVGIMRQRRRLAPPQTHSDVKPAPGYDRAALMRTGRASPSSESDMA